MQTSPAPIPSPDLIRAALAVFMARAAAETLEPVIEKIQSDILKTHEFIYIDPFAHRAPNPGEARRPKRLTAFADAHNLPDEQSSRLYEILEAEYINAGFTDGRESGHCPLLIARSLERQATDLFILASQEINPLFDVAELETLPCQERTEYAELMLSCVGKYIKPADNPFRN